MSELKILKPSDLTLRRKSDFLDRKILRTNSFQKQIDELLDFVYSSNYKGVNRRKNVPSTVGISYIQLGVPLRVCAVDLGIGHKGYNDIHMMINPEIIWSSKTKQYRAEGCVNLPSTWGLVERAYRVRASFLDRSGNKVLIDVKGWPAILLQHEIDHHNGILFIDRLKDPKKAHSVDKDEYAAYKKAKDDWGKFVDVSKITRPLS
jgi:peptide deformylase